MDELALLKDMGDQTPLPSPAELAPARDRLVAALDTDVPPARHRRRRLLVGGIAVVGIAAAIAAVVSFGVLAPVGIAPPEADAVAVLHQAADVARTLPATPPRPDQFFYTRSRLADGTIREAWFSADGTHDGLIVQHGLRIPMPGCRHGEMQVYRGELLLPGVVEPCTPSPAYRTDLPTDAAGMREYLGRAGTEGEDFDTLIHFALSEAYVLPQTMAALFEVMAEFPGLTLDEDATDAAGRPGLGITWPQPPDQESVTLVLDPRTHVLIGISDSYAILAQAVVDAPGQRP